jgi:hypothetical protein
MIVARAEGCTYAAKVWDVPIVQGPFLSPRAKAPIVTTRNFSTAVSPSSKTCHPWRALVIRLRGLRGRGGCGRRGQPSQKAGGRARVHHAPGRRGGTRGVVEGDDAEGQGPRGVAAPTSQPSSRHTARHSHRTCVVGAWEQTFVTRRQGVRGGGRHRVRGRAAGALSCDEKAANRRLGFGTGRQKPVLERGANPKHSRRTCSPRYGLQYWLGESAGVAKRPRERSPIREIPYGGYTIRNCYR